MSKVLTWAKRAAEKALKACHPERSGLPLAAQSKGPYAPIAACVQ